MIKRTSVCIFLLVLVSCARAFLYVRPTIIAGISTQTSKSMSANTNLFEYLEFNTLVSVEECIRAHNTMKEQGSTLTEKDSKSVFVDASWWHKGDLNGRKMYVQRASFLLSPMIWFWISHRLIPAYGYLTFLKKGLKKVRESLDLNTSISMTSH